VITPSPDTVRSLRARWISPRYGVLNVAQLILLNCTVLAWIWQGSEVVPFLVYLPSAILLCLILQRQNSEWFHEAAHYNLIPNRTWNDRIADGFLGTLNGSQIRSYRVGHFRHHAVDAYFLNDDPDTRFLMAESQGELLRGFWRDVTGRTALSYYYLSFLEGTESCRAAQKGVWLFWLVGVHSIGFTITVLANRFWIYPIYFAVLLTLYPVLNRIRSYSQHAAIVSEGRTFLVGSNAARTIHSSMLERVLLQSSVMMYHHEHHESPTTPWRALRAQSLQLEDQNTFAHSGLNVAWRVLRGLPK
jgi:fatty acid desaturase